MWLLDAPIEWCHNGAPPQIFFRSRHIMWSKLDIDLIFCNVTSVWTYQNSCNFYITLDRHLSQIRASIYSIWTWKMAAMEVFNGGTEKHNSGNVVQSSPWNPDVLENIGFSEAIYPPILHPQTSVQKVRSLPQQSRYHLLMTLWLPLHNMSMKCDQCELHVTSLLLLFCACGLA